MIEQTHQEWLSDYKARVTRRADQVRFRCPSCGHCQSPADFRDEGLDPQLAYVECIGRHVDGGCDWAAFGLLGTLGKGRVVVMADDTRQEVFDFADPAVIPTVDEWLAQGGQMEEL